MNKKWVVAIGLISVLAIFGLTGCEQGTVSTGEIGTIKVTSQQEGIWVNGQGEVSVTPDIATINLGIEAEGVTVAEARDKAAEAMDAVMAALTANGIADKDIQTTYFAINEVYSWDKDTERSGVTGYRVSNTVTVTVRNIENVGVVIDEVVAAGGDFTRVNNIGFSVDDPSAYYEQAREIAMADARAKAEQIAKLSDLELGSVTYVSESSYYVPVIQRASGAMYDTAESVPTSISAGELDISISLQVTFDIK